MNTREIKAYMNRKGMRQCDLAKKMGMNVSTLNRKINNTNGQNLTVKEAYQIVAILNIPRDNLNNIFFATELAETQDNEF